MDRAQTPQEALARSLERQKASVEAAKEVGQQIAAERAKDAETQGQGGQAEAK